MLNAYNRIAGFYASLSSFMFGDSINKIQKLLIQQLPQEGSILLLGGGNGTILPDIFEYAPNLEIEFLEASNQMIELAKQKSSISQNIIYNHNANFKHLRERYDIIYCGFFLDQFEETEIQRIIKLLDTPKTKWFVSDFNLNETARYRVWREFQIVLSILFFKVVAKHKPRYLPPIFQIFPQLGYSSLFSVSLGSGFYHSQIFMK